MGYTAKNYTEQGAERTVIGGVLDVSGGSISLPSSSLKIIVASGRNGAGNITATGAVSGDRVAGVLQITGTQATIADGTFGVVANAANSIAQASVSDLSTIKYAFFLSTPSA